MPGLGTDRAETMNRRMRLSISETLAPRGLHLAGELDISTSKDLAAALDPLLVRGGEIVLDLSELTFMDSTGLQVLIRSALQLEDRGRIVLRSPSRLVRSILALAIHTDKLPTLTVADDEVDRPAHS